MQHTPITGSFREASNGQHYTFSVKAFKKWKERFLKEYREQYSSAFKTDVPNSRERVYISELSRCDL